MISPRLRTGLVRFRSLAIRFLNVPTGLLLVFLQRTPVLPLAAMLERLAEATPAGVVLKAGVGLAALGAVDTLAGATTGTQLVSTVSLPAAATVGVPFQMAIYITGRGVSYAQSWDVTNTLPPGITPAGATLSGNKWALNSTTLTYLLISGTPTTPGTYTFTADGWQYTNLSGPVTSGTAQIIVSPAATGSPTITTQPQSQTVSIGGSVTFTAAATGTPAPTYQWRKGTSNVSGATNASLTLSNVQAADAGTYTLVATNSAGTAISNGAVLTIANTSAPAITLQPVSRTVFTGGSVTFNLTATGAPTPTYQWSKDGTVIPGATAASLTVSSASATDAGTYFAVATNAVGTATTAAATLGVLAPGTLPTTLLSALSVRTTLGAGQTLIPGFVTNGSKSLLLRLGGPVLNQYGLSGLPDPKLQVFNSSGVMTYQNDNWDPSLGPLFNTVGAGPYTAGSLDSGLVISLNGLSSSYCYGTGAGTVLCELFDTDTSNYAARLVAVSARNQVGTGADVLIGGFVINGTGSKTLLIRGLGPGLVAQGVTSGYLADPYLEIHDLAGNVIASNDNWDSSLIPIFNQVGAASLTTGSKDAALLITLPAGVYTATISGVNGTTGNGMVEVFEVWP